MISHEDISYCVVWLFLFHTREPYPRALKVLVEIYGARVPPVPLAAIIAAFFSSSSSLMTGTYSLLQSEGHSKVLVEIYGARVPPVPLAAIIAAFFGSVLGKKTTWSASHSREFANSKFTGAAPSTLLMTI